MEETDVTKVVESETADLQEQLSVEPAPAQVPIAPPKSRKSIRFRRRKQQRKRQARPTDTSGRAFLTNLLTFLVTTIIVLPTFILLHRFIPFIGIPYHIDRIFLLLILFLLFFFLLKKIKYYVWILLGLIFAGLFVGSTTGHYGFEDVYWDYRGLVTNLANESKSLRDIEAETTFPRRQTIIKAIEFTNKDIRAFSHTAVKKNFVKQANGNNKMYVQCFAVWKAINDEWIYIKDPTDREYIAKASESVQLLSGDCDDYSILMAACLKSIGASVRLVRTPNHIYPELRFESKADLDNCIYLIRNKLFKKYAKNKTINYHTDKNGVLWLNMDYTAPYPGGKFLSEETTAVLEL